LLTVVPISGTVLERMEVKDRIRVERTRQGLSRNSLAGKLKMSRRDLWRLETGEIRILAEDVPRFAKALGVSIAKLYGERDPRRARRTAAA
jgi:transcriptional regulator with XRE-family HTH domain